MNTNERKTKNKKVGGNVWWGEGGGVRKTV